MHKNCKLVYSSEERIAKICTSICIIDKRLPKRKRIKISSESRMMDNLKRMYNEWRKDKSN